MWKRQLPRDRFLASMSHELRTPPPNAHPRLHRHPADEVARPADPRSERQFDGPVYAPHLLSLINDLLDLAQRSSPESEVEPGAVGAWRVRKWPRPAPVGEAKGLGFVATSPRRPSPPSRNAAPRQSSTSQQRAIQSSTDTDSRLQVGGAQEAAERDGIHVCRSTGDGIKTEDQARLFAFTQVEASGKTAL